MIRRATIEDLPRILEIYNYYVENTTLAFDWEPRTHDKGVLWFESHDERHPIIVQDDPVGGWASLSEWAPHEGYMQTAELSIFVDRNQRGNGLGRELFNSILRIAGELDYHCIISRITEGNDVSRRMHEKSGFRYIGHMNEVGLKFDKWLNVHLYQKVLNETEQGSPDNVG